LVGNIAGQNDGTKETTKARGRTSWKSALKKGTYTTGGCGSRVQLTYVQ
jgi:hypothetical protein